MVYDRLLIVRLAFGLSSQSSLPLPTTGSSRPSPLFYLWLSRQRLRVPRPDAATSTNSCPDGSLGFAAMQPRSCPWPTCLYRWSDRWLTRFPLILVQPLGLQVSWFLDSICMYSEKHLIWYANWSGRHLRRLLATSNIANWRSELAANVKFKKRNRFSECKGL